MGKYKIAFIVGSLRKESFNRFSRAMTRLSFSSDDIVAMSRSILCGMLATLQPQRHTRQPSFSRII